MSWLLVTNAVGRSEPFQRTTELSTKESILEPYTVRVKAGPPTVATSGERPLIAGMGLAPLILKFTGFELPPPGAGLVFTSRVARGGGVFRLLGERYLTVFAPTGVSAGLKGIHFRRFALSHLSEGLPWGTPTR